ncbi:MAG: Ig-like domain-containing protein, partial [Candidatus Acidiferrum sp.]
MRTASVLKARIHTLVTIGFLLATLLSGCGREQVPVVAPAIVSVTPTNGATAVPVATLVTATFNKAMNPTTINTSTFTLADPTGAAVAGTVTYSGTTAIFTSTFLLAPSSLYTATITTGAADAIGAHLASNFIWSFTTGTIPTVIFTNPVNGATNIAINRKITATFSEAMNSASVTAAGTFSLALAGVGGALVPGTVTYVAGANTATFAPAVNLLPNTQYTATISTAAQSAAGNNLAANYVFSFTTGATADVTPPTVIATVPVSGATNVPTNQIITATFSEAMDPATITATGTFTVAVAGVGGAAVTGTVSYAGTTATFTPTAALTASTQYTATISNAALDLSGNALVPGVAPNPWSFTTGAGPDTTPPTITLTSPADADVNVALNKAVSATFSEAMDPLTITAAGTFTLAVAGVGGADVPGTVT